MINLKNVVIKAEGETSKEAEEFKTSETIWKESEPLIMGMIEKLRNKFKEFGELQHPEDKGGKLEIDGEEYKYSLYFDSDTDKLESIALKVHDPGSKGFEELHQFLFVEKKTKYTYMKSVPGEFIRSYILRTKDKEGEEVFTHEQPETALKSLKKLNERLEKGTIKLKLEEKK